VWPSGSRVPAASSATGVPAFTSSVSGALPPTPFTTTSGLWFALFASLIVQSIRAAKSCWKAWRQRQIDA
jgi:hypothetical protein